MDPDVGPGDIVQIEPHNGLVWAIWLSAGDVAYWNARLAECNLDIQSLIDDDAEPEEIKQAQRDLKEAFSQQRTAIREMRSASKMALDAGLQERQVALAERMGAIITSAIQTVTGELGLTRQQEARLPDAVKRALLELEAPGGTTAPRPKAALRSHKVADVIDMP